MDPLQRKLIIDFHKQEYRQGPGGETETLQALKLAGLDRSRPLHIADIGCGTGASTIQLAKELDATITAVDFLPEFLEVLQLRAMEHDVSHQITPLNCSMDALPFEDDHFDVIWSEGAVYNMGFEAGITAWRRFLKPGGMLIVSEITWLTTKRPEELETYWLEAYPEIDVASAKMGILERHGYSPVGYFVLPPHCWLEHYYRPRQTRFSAFLERHQQSSAAQALIAEEQKEILMYETYRRHYSYGVYIARKI